jgi:hypothetical protein
MKKTFLFCFITISVSAMPQSIVLQEKLQPLPFGSIQPAGWIKEQMQKDMAGFVGNLDQLVPSLINDPIYGESRLMKHSKAKDLGNLKSGDAEGDEQYKWWNSETQSNWRDAYIRNALLLNDANAIEKTKRYIDKILATQDADGYLGIYDKELRYHFTGENGELWAKATLYRGLLAYYECTQDQKVWNALLKAVDNVMQNYPINHSDPFNVGNGFSGGVAHGLTFTDVLDRMYQLTGDKKYWDYAAFLFMNFSNNFSSEKDVQLKNIFDPTYKLQSHGAHTYEHTRSLIVAAYATGNADLQKALSIYLTRLKNATTRTGGAIGDEWIGGRTANSTNIGYEYCSLHELMNSYTVLLQKTGNNNYANDAENIFYNAAQGSRNPDHSCIAYLKTDNSYEMMGTKNGEVEAGRNQTRYKYSPAHQDVAVCCNPNAGRITPYFIQSAWMKETDTSLVATLLAPTVVNTSVKHINLKIEEITAYPYLNNFTFKITPEKDIRFILKIRKPEWVRSIRTKEKYSIKDGYVLIDRKFSTNDQVVLEFVTDVEVREDVNYEKFFTYGELVFAKPIAATEQRGKVYAPNFEDWMYAPKEKVHYGFIDNHQARYVNGKIVLQLKNEIANKVEKIELIPLGKTILRQVSFK